MRIGMDKTYVPQARDILSWVGGGEKILFMVTENDRLSNEMKGVTLFDNRGSGYSAPHMVSFQENYYNFRLHLVCKREKAWYDFDFDEWREQNGE